MIPNLIQNYIHTQTKTPAPKKKEAPPFDIHQELKNRNFIKPLKGEGHLIKGNIFDVPSNMVHGIAYDFKALKHAVKGEANDHQLGKLNDLGMKLGGLAIASYLFTKRQAPSTKAMEFVGLGSFFASMALWPKLAIQLPARLLYGFNVQQQYEDSMGRKKPFFQDPQFLPWDLYSDEEINKIGDYMGVPRNIQNRRDFIQEKMKKIAIQSNTLWMLTAGFATPVMSALICNQLEKPVASILSPIRNYNNNKILSNFNSAVPNDKTIIKRVNDILSINQNKPLTKELMSEISKAMTKDFISVYVTDAIEKDFKNLFVTGNYTISNKSIATIIKESYKALGGDIPQEILEKILPTQEELTKYFDYEKGYFQNEQTPNQINKIFREYIKDFKKKLTEYNKNNPDQKLTSEQMEAIKSRIMYAPDESNPILKGLKTEPYAVLNTNNQKIIKSVTSALNTLNNKLKAVDKFVLHQFGNIQESSIADFWNNTTRVFIKCLNLTPEQINLIKQDRMQVAEVIRKAYDKIASDRKHYNQVVTDLAKQISKINNAIKKIDTNDNVLKYTEQTNFDKRMDTIFQEFIAELSKDLNLPDGDMKNIISELTASNNGYNFPYSNNGSYKEIYKSMVKNRLLGVKSSLYRILNSLDLYRRIATGTLDEKTLFDKVPREVREDIIELSKSLGINAHSSDFYTKFYKQRNPNPDFNDMSNIRVRNGKVIYKYHEGLHTPNKVDIPHDPTLFIKSMLLQYNMPISKETDEILKPFADVAEEFNSYRQIIFNKVGNLEYIEKKHHKVGTNCDLNSKAIFNLIGASTDEIVHNYCKQAYNTRKWLNMFGKTGGILLGLTLFAQLFFGKMKTPKPIPQTTETKKG